jgi:murein DD-endopeptidase MepM/ murein hydrolase activator NlpD
MRKAPITSLFLLFLFVMPSLFAYADEKSDRLQELQRQIDELTRQAEQYKDNIQATQEQAQTLKSEISALNNQMSRIKNQINITDKKVDTTKIKIGGLEDQVVVTQRKLDKNRGAIGRLVATVNESDHQNLLMILLKSSGLSEFANQAQETADLNNKLLSVVDELTDDRKALEDQQQDLESEKKQLEQLYQQQINDRNSLAESEAEKNSILKKTKGQEQAYQRLLSDVEQKQAQFFAEMKQLEGEALKTGAVILHVTATAVPPKGSKIFKMPEDHGILTQGYGLTKYARSGAYGGAPHNGIDIAIGYGTPLHPVAEGTVISSGYNDGFGNWIAIRHANNIVTIYGHMRAPTTVGNGAQVTTDSVIGYEGKTGNVTGSHVHLSVYKDFFTYQKNGQFYFNYYEGSLNPLDYL